jgi:bifunctional UDP-N-acetylglucosamine pyrophosphorylase/glucosamine-1-phosphate N-acetyltransferase
MDHIVLILAAGEGKRMKSELPKVLHIVKGKPMIIHVIETAASTKPKKIILIVGKHYQTIKNCIELYNIKNIEYVFQKDPLGTGHAINCCKYLFFQNYNCNFLILSGDVPFIKKNTIESLLTIHNNVSIIVTNLIDPTGYGRIIKDYKGNFNKIVEEKDCNDIEKNITTVNTGIYLFNSILLDKYIDKINNNNANNEYYLTDILKIIKDNETNIKFNLFEISLEDQYQILGVNNQNQLNYLNNLKI